MSLDNACLLGSPCGTATSLVRSSRAAALTKELFTSICHPSPKAQQLDHDDPFYSKAFASTKAVSSALGVFWERVETHTPGHASDVFSSLDLQKPSVNAEEFSTFMAAAFELIGPRSFEQAVREVLLRLREELGEPTKCADDHPAKVRTEASLASLVSTSASLDSPMSSRSSISSSSLSTTPRHDSSQIWDIAQGQIQPPSASVDTIRGSDLSFRRFRSTSVSIDVCEAKADSALVDSDSPFIRQYTDGGSPFIQPTSTWSRQCSNCSVHATPAVHVPANVYSVEETLFVFDWDDTLCPSSFITEDPRIIYKDRCPCFGDCPDMLLDPCDKNSGLLVDALTRHAKAVTDLLEAAASYGKVIILTLARDGWIKTSSDNFLPGVWQVLQDLGVECIYARDSTSARQLRVAMEDDVDVWQLLKTRAMQSVIERFYSSRKGHSWKNITSIGDSIIERDALMEVTFTHAQLDTDGEDMPLSAKTVKLLSDPGLAELTEELQLLEGYMKAIGGYHGNIDLEWDDLTEARTALDLVDSL